MCRRLSATVSVLSALAAVLLVPAANAFSSPSGLLQTGNAGAAVLVPGAGPRLSLMGPVPGGGPWAATQLMTITNWNGTFSYRGETIWSGAAAKILRIGTDTISPGYPTPLRLTPPPA